METSMETNVVIPVDTSMNFYDQILDVADIIHKHKQLKELTFKITIDESSDPYKLRDYANFIQFLGLYHENITVNLEVIDNAGLF